MLESCIALKLLMLHEVFQGIMKCMILLNVVLLSIVIVRFWATKQRAYFLFYRLRV